MLGFSLQPVAGAKTTRTVEAPRTARNGKLRKRRLFTTGRPSKSSGTPLANGATIRRWGTEPSSRNEQAKRNFPAQPGLRAKIVRLFQVFVKVATFGGSEGGGPIFVFGPSAEGGDLERAGSPRLSRDEQARSKTRVNGGRTPIRGARGHRLCIVWFPSVRSTRKTRRSAGRRNLRRHREHESPVANADGRTSAMQKGGTRP